MSRDVLTLIDAAVDDWTVSHDAMRSLPDTATRPPNVDDVYDLRLHLRAELELLALRGVLAIDRGLRQWRWLYRKLGGGTTRPD